MLWEVRVYQSRYEQVGAYATIVGQVIFTEGFTHFISALLALAIRCGNGQSIHASDRRGQGAAFDQSYIYEAAYKALHYLYKLEYGISTRIF